VDFLINNAFLSFGKIQSLIYTLDHAQLTECI